MQEAGNKRTFYISWTIYLYLHFCHVSQHTEYDEASHEACDAVDSAGDDGVLVAVVVELVVAGQG